MDIRGYAASILIKAFSTQTNGSALKTDAQIAETKSADEEKAQRKIKSAKDVLARLIEAQKEQREEAKAAARKKVEQLKQRLQMLQQMFSGDPEKLAKAIAQVAKELKAAVKAYGGTDGGSASLTGTANTADTTVQTGVTKAAGEAVTLETGAAETGANPDEVPAEETPHAQTGSQNLTAEQRQAQEKQAEAREDSDFAKEARDLMRKIKALLEQAKADAKLDATQSEAENPQTTEAISEADKALKSLDSELSDLETSSNTTLFATGLVISLTV